MAITPYRPAPDLFRNFFDDFLGSEVPVGGRLAGTDMLRTPTADVMETKEDIRITIELPGMRTEDVEVNLENNLLTISGEKREARREEEGRWHLSERRYGRFSRSFVLPRDVDQDRVAADFKNGILSVTIPKSERAKSRRIEIGGETGRTEVGTGSR